METEDNTKCLSCEEFLALNKKEDSGKPVKAPGDVQLNRHARRRFAALVKKAPKSKLRDEQLALLSSKR